MPSRAVTGRPRSRMMPSTMTVARLERIAHWISGGTSGSASFTAGWLKPQVRQMNTTSAMLAASSGRVWLAGQYRRALLQRVA